MPLPFEIDLDVLEALPKAQRVVEDAELALVKSLVEKDPLWAYVPHAKQRIYHALDCYVAGFVGGNRSGKTWGGTADDLIQLCDRDSLPPWLEPFKRWEEFHCWVITPNLVSTLEKIVLPVFKKLVPRPQLWKESWDKAYDGRNRRLQFKNGNTVDFMSHDQDLESFQGASLQRVRFDEEPPGNKGRRIFEECEARVMDTEGELRFTMTPLLGLSWTYHLLTVKGRPRWEDDTRVVTVDQDENPHLSEAAKRRWAKGKSEAQLQARRSGKWVHFAGLVYGDEWDKSTHVVDHGQLSVDGRGKPCVPRDQNGKPTVRVYVGIDPGIAHPTAVVWAWVDSADRLVVFDSFKESGATVGDVVSRIDQVNARWDVKPSRYVIDPSARNKHHATGRSLQSEYQKHGINPRLGQNDRRAGFNRVKELLDNDLFVVTSSNTEWVDEIEEYRWKPPKGTDDAGREEPVKVNDDFMDATRYLVMDRPRPKKLADADRAEDDDPRRRLMREHLDRLRRRPREHSLLGAIFQ